MSKRRRPAKRKPGERYLAFQFWEIESPAFQALSADATRVYIFLRKRLSFDCSNNGAVPFSHRDATAALKAGWRRGSNAIAELEHYGFIKQRNRGQPGPNIRLASEWQLTAFPYGGQPASKTFMRWQGEAFERPCQGALGKPTMAQRESKRQLPICNMKMPRRQHEDACPDGKIGSEPTNGQSVGNVKTHRGGGRRQHEDTITVTSQGGLLQNTPESIATSRRAHHANRKPSRRLSDGELRDFIARREEAGLNRQALSCKAGLNARYLDMVENRRRNPSPDAWHALNKALTA